MAKTGSKARQNMVAGTPGPVQVPGTALTSPPNIAHRLPAYKAALPGWQRVRDCVDGQYAVKARSPSYLPYLHPSDTSPANRDRNASYADRAVFVGITKRTLKGLVGQVFAKDAILELPPALEDCRDSIDGSAVSWDQQAKQALADTLGVGRCGLLVDYPTVTVEEGRTAPTIAQQKALALRPTVQYYFAEQIINWRVEMRGGLRMTTLVVLEEMYDIEDDGFEAKQDTQWRELRLRDGVYYQQIWRKANGVFIRYGDEIVPTIANGKTLNYIPFQFVGSDNNDPGVDDSPLLPLADQNIAHYRNSADFEELVSLVGQPTPYFTGLTQKWIDDVWGEGIALGSRAAIPLPVNATAGLLEVSESNIALTAMEHKERQMVAIGAKLVEQTTVQRTATEVGQDEATEASVLQTAAQNVSDAYTKVIEWLAAFAGAPHTSEHKYLLNTDFEISRMTVEARRQLLSEWMEGAISTTEYRDLLRRTGIATQEDEEAIAEIESATANDMEFSLGNMERGNVTQLPIRKA